MTPFYGESVPLWIQKKIHGYGLVWSMQKSSLSPALQETAPYLGPGGCVPLETGPLKASGLFQGLLGDITFRGVAGLDLPINYLQAKHNALLHPSAAGGVTLRRRSEEQDGQQKAKT